MAGESTIRPRKTENNGKVVKLQRRKRKKTLYAGDFWLLALVVILVIFGVSMVFSASYYSAIGNNESPYSYLIKAIVYAAIGFVLLVFLAMMDYHILTKYAIPIAVISLILLVIVLVPSIGKEINFATRWIRVGPITIMPGEIAKPACIILVSSYLSKQPDRIRDLKTGVIPVLGIMAVFCGLIFLQPNLSTMLTLSFIIVGIMFIAGLRRAHLGVIILCGGVALGAYLLRAANYQSGRLQRFWDPFSDPSGGGYQVSQGLLALGSGRVFGVGLGKSMQKTLYLPEPQNDFILAIIGEELGFIGILLLLTAYLLLIWRCVRIAMKAPDMLGTLIASGITIMISVQVIMNVMIVTAMMPPTGVILPFISWGGNALVIFIGCMGIMMNISRFRRE